MSVNTIAKPASEKQVNFIAKLLGERDLSNYPMEKEGAARMVANGFIKIPSSSASACIGELLALPFLGKLIPDSSEKPASDPEVPSGRYAIRVDAVVKFYRVDNVTEGKWAGRTFVKAQASDDEHPVRNAAARTEILKAIAADPKAASLLYGRELGHCGVCGRTLTDEASRAAGIGPVCSSKSGW